MFDVNTLLVYRSFFAATEVIEQAGRRLVWRGQTAPDVTPRAICEAIFEDDGGPAKTHRHRQRHFPEAEVRAAIEQAGLICIDVYGLYTDAILRQPLDEGIHTKAVYISKLPQP